MLQTASDGHTARGTLRGGAIVLDQPLDLPEGTEVVLNVRVRVHTPEASEAGATAAYEPGGRTDISNEELLRLAKQHPAPQEWWDATDDPFQP